MRLRIMALVLAASAAWLAAPAQRVFDMDLWQGKVKVKGSDPADTAKVRVFLPEAKNATVSGRAGGDMPRRRIRASGDGT